MGIRNGAAFLVAIFLLALNSLNPAFAHRFNVALVIPMTSAGNNQGRQYLEGFMLATSERDSHADEESDGHLGGLDVYVTVIDALGDVSTEFERIVSQAEINIVAAFGSEELLFLVGKLVERERLVLLLPAQTPFPQSDMPAVAAFAFAYENQYGGRPSTQAAQGYNTARRIDVAVRAQGGIDDKELLVQSFRETAYGFVRGKDE
jgi:hypothetical protein